MRKIFGWLRRLAINFFEIEERNPIDLDRVIVSLGSETEIELLNYCFNLRIPMSCVEHYYCFNNGRIIPNSNLYMYTDEYTLIEFDMLIFDMVSESTNYKIPN